MRPSGPVGQDPKLLRRVEELTVHSEKLAARAEIAERDASALRGLADRQRKDLTTVRETLKLLRSNLASFLEESQGR